MTTQKPLAGLRDEIYDAVAEGRHSIRVAWPSISDDAAEFRVTFTLRVDRETYALLTANADRQKRSLTKVMRRYCKDAFAECISASDETPPAE
jgi:hypothetical protein